MVFLHTLIQPLKATAAPYPHAISPSRPWKLRIFLPSSAPLRINSVDDDGGHKRGQTEKREKCIEGSRVSG
ncbi:hypothetical protein SESBI_39002 [Sesbania bispinosa]|nr:hypothetical protein SESBI_39002 [Sesbania bispinosa]